MPPRQVTNLPPNMIQEIVARLNRRNYRALRATSVAMRDAFPIATLPAALKKLVKQHQKTRKYKLRKITLHHHLRRNDPPPADLQAMVGKVLTAGELMELIKDMTRRVIDAAEALGADRDGIVGGIKVEPMPRLPRTEDGDSMWVNFRAIKSPQILIKSWFWTSVTFQRNRISMSPRLGSTDLEYDVKHSAAHDNAARALFVLGAYQIAAEKWPTLNQTPLHVKFYRNNAGLRKRLNATKFPKEVKAVLDMEFRDIEFVAV